MSEHDIHVIGEIAPKPAEPTKVAVVELSAILAELREGDNVIARLARNGAAEWLITIYITGLSFEGFYVTKRSEGIDALRDLGTLYHAARTGALS
ncbi:hypothetical protein [Mycobacteroides chelonae]|uniref:hypothetical protein n=1 Tax=Mycobacteroides chelonae TaxID=1774 RepID=UPI0009923A9E|nr:hypothetical protein [Mycobacteroides chelonae]